MSVRLIMEQSVPEMEELQRKAIFSRQEITMIMRRRTDFEQRIQGRGAQPRDFVRYADFEANLDKLRLKRISRLGSSGHDVHTSFGNSGFRKVLSVFDRATRRFPGDTDLWKRYISYVKEQDAIRVVYRAYSKLLSLQPTNTEAWISAAKYEFEENANAKGARDLYMRGLRFNADSEKLWLSYAQFELAYVAKLLSRRKIMGLSTASQQKADLAEEKSKYEARLRKSDADLAIDDNADVIKVDASDDEEEEEINSADLDVLGNPDSNPVLRGDIALALFDSCVAEMTKNVAPDMKDSVLVRTSKHFLALFDQYEMLDREHLHYHVLQYLQDALPNSPETVFLDVTLPLRNVSVSDASLAENLQLSVNKYLAYKQKATADEKPVLTKRFIDYLSEKYLDSDSVSAKTSALLKAIIQKCR